KTTPLVAAQLHELAWHARNNLVALARGLTPNYYLYGVPDFSVSGLALTGMTEQSGEPLVHSVEMSMRPGVPLQATLFRLSEGAAQVVPEAGVEPDPLRVGLTALHAPAIHGTLSPPALRGFDPARRALVAIEQDRSVVMFTPKRTADEVLAATRSEAEALNPD